MSEIVTIIMGGGQGARLFPLTRDRAKPAVPVGGRARLIDIALSNCINSGLTRIFVLTQFNSASLNRHINRTYNFGSLMPAGVEVIAAELTAESRDWFQGTADAVRRSLRHVLDQHARLALILAGDHLYKMDYRPFLQRHEESRADITIAVCPVSAEHASSFGLLHCDQNGLVTHFAEKPTGQELEAMRIDPETRLPDGQRARAPFLASMGIYVFDPAVLAQLLEDNPEHHDFGREILPGAVGSRRLAVHFFQGYWEDIGTISAFYRANIALATERQYSLYDPDFPLYTRPRHLSPTQVGRAQIEDSLIAEGSRIGDARIERSVIGVRSRIGEDVLVDGALVMGNDNYENEAEQAACRAEGLPPLGIGSGSVVRGAILDKGVRVGRGVKLVNQNGLDNWEGDGIYIRDGIVIVPRRAVVPDGTVV